MYIIKLTVFLIFTLLIICIYLPVLIILFPWRTAVGPELLQYYSIICLRIFRVTVERSDRHRLSVDKNRGIILISNHVSFLDIFLLSALYRTIYTSKIEVKHYPVIGQIAWLMGIIFLRRDSPEDRHRVIRTIADKSRGRILTIFAQGTTSSIAESLPFKCGIFKTLEIAPSIVLFPVTIHYKEDNDIAWTKEQILFDNLKRVCGQNRIHVRVTIHEQISIDDYLDKTISEICAIAQERVLSKLWTDY
jgi:1-acyl-sn-glycerol-3-phosphate acyltransferase